MELGHAFKSIHPLLWLAAGARGERPALDEGDNNYSLAPECGYAVLFNEDVFRDFEDGLEASGIAHVFRVTDSEEAYAEMRERLGPALQRRCCIAISCATSAVSAPSRTSRVLTERGLPGRVAVATRRTCRR